MTIRSMTGYGQASVELAGTRVTIEVRSLNHRYADVRLRLPDPLAPREREIRRKVLRRVQRGRVELTVAVEPLKGRESAPQLNLPLLEELLGASKTLIESHGLRGEPDVNTVLAVSGMFRAASLELDWDDEQLELLERALDAALEAHDGERCREGRHLQNEISGRLSTMTRIAADIRARAAEVPVSVRDRLVERLEALSKDVELEPARIAQEAALLADRYDVTEELVRLEGHLEQARTLMDRPDGKPVGKRLDFLLQEIQRETNTVNSKSADLDLSRHALALKSELEKVREQVQNVE